jgi:hypothetical protein
MMIVVKTPFDVRVVAFGLVISLIFEEATTLDMILLLLVVLAFILLFIFLLLLLNEILNPFVQHSNTNSIVIIMVTIASIRYMYSYALSSMDPYTTIVQCTVLLLLLLIQYYYNITTIYTDFCV